MVSKAAIIIAIIVLILLIIIISLLLWRYKFRSKADNIGSADVQIQYASDTSINVFVVPIINKEDIRTRPQSYTVFYATNPNFTNGFKKDSRDPLITITGLLTNTKYYIQAQWTNIDGVKSQMSKFTNTVTIQEPPPPITLNSVHFQKEPGEDTLEMIVSHTEAEAIGKFYTIYWTSPPDKISLAASSENESPSCNNTCTSEPIKGFTVGEDVSVAVTYNDANFVLTSFSNVINCKAEVNNVCTS